MGFQLDEGDLSMASQLDSNHDLDNGDDGGTGGDIATPTPPPAAYKPEALAWESTSKPERYAWSAATLDMVSNYFDGLNPANDIEFFCPPYDSLSRDQKVNAWAGLFAAMAYYESSWNPASASVDVGVEGDLDTYSVGLLQMSVVDQANYGFQFGYDYNDLKTAIPNLHLGIAIMAKQIQKKGKILIPKGETGVYWAVLRPGGTYDKSAQIATMTKKLSFCK